MVLGVLEQTGIHPPGVEMNGVAPTWAIVLGVVVLVIGIVSTVGLRTYMRFATRTFKTFRPVARPMTNLA